MILDGILIKALLGFLLWFIIIGGLSVVFIYSILVLGKWEDDFEHKKRENKWD